MIDNAATALQTIQWLPQDIPVAAIRQGLHQASVEALSTGSDTCTTGKAIEVIMDVAHNPQAAQMLCHRLERIRQQAEPLQCLLPMKIKIIVE